MIRQTTEKRENMEELFNTPQKIRCRDCACLTEGKNKTWKCDECGKDIHDIPDDECPESIG